MSATLNKWQVRELLSHLGGIDDALRIIEKYAGDRAAVLEVGIRSGRENVNRVRGIIFDAAITDIEVEQIPGAAEETTAAPDPGRPVVVEGG